MIIREATENDLDNLLALYTQLNSSNVMEYSENINELYQSIINDKNQFIFVAEKNEQILSTCTLSIINNLTHRQRPYAVIENVVTDRKYRNKGYSEKLLFFAVETAKTKRCHKIVLLTYSKLDYVKKMYEKVGFNGDVASGFVLNFETEEQL